MLRSTLIASLMLSTVAGVALESKAIESAKNPAPLLFAQATPQTIQVERGGAQIYTQPDSNAQVIGEYRAGVVLSPRLRLFSPEGQAWLRIGDHWIAEESVMVFEGETNTLPASARPTPIDLPTPASASAPPKVSPQQPNPQPSPSPAETPSQQKTPAASPTSPPITAPQPASAKPGQSEPAGETTKQQPTSIKQQEAAKPQPAPAKPQSKSPSKPQPDATAKSSDSSKGMLITKDPTAQVNVRTANNTQSDVIHAGNAGDQVQILKSQAGESGYTWYQVKFPVAKVQGWVRGDFIQLGSQ